MNNYSLSTKALGSYTGVLPRHESPPAVVKTAPYAGVRHDGHLPFFPSFGDRLDALELVLFRHVLTYIGAIYGAPLEGGLVTPAYGERQLAEHAGVSSKTIGRWLTRCVKAGVVEPMRRDGKKSRFWVILPEDDEFDCRQGFTHAEKQAIKSWIPRPTKQSRRWQDVNPAVIDGARRYRIDYVISWYRARTKERCGVTPTGLASENFIAYYRYVVSSREKRLQRAEVDAFYETMTVVIDHWGACKKWMQVSLQRRNKRYFDPGPYPPLGKYRPLFHMWREFAKNYRR